MGICSRLPKFDSILDVFGLTSLLIYGWTAYWFAWNVPSWLNFLVPSEIITVLCYSLFTDGLECLAIVAVALLIAVVVPSRWVRDDFVFRSSITIICVLLFLMKMLWDFVHLADIPLYIFYMTVSLLCVHVIFARISFVKNFINDLADRSIVFLYLTIPASVLATMAVLARNIF